MKYIDPSIKVMEVIDTKKIMLLLEEAGRNCYKSEDLIKEGSCDTFLTKILDSNHMSVIEHEKITVKIIGSRAMSHQLVRHRIASYSQESQRYCNYTRDKFGDDIVFIKPIKYNTWNVNVQGWFDKSLEDAEKTYNLLIFGGMQAQDARAVLPNACKTEIVVTMNLSAWRHFIKTRTDTHAQDEIRFITNLLLVEFKKDLPIIFGDL